MRITSVHGDEAGVLRAQRSTPAAEHHSGALVRYGASFEREVLVPMHREEWSL